MARRKLFTVTRKDLVVQTFRAGGPGGQRQNKRDTGVRIVHPESGAAGESRTERSQHRNKRLALERLANSEKFRAWVKVRAAQATGQADDLERRVDEMMQPYNLRIEGVGPDGCWHLLEESE